jgi:P4 family phage/plasmid primase-like protien
MNINNGLLQRAKERLPITVLWTKLGLQGEPPARDGVKFCSPLREDRHPSCTLSDDGTRFHDWAQSKHFDSYDFFQAATGSEPKSAFVPFVEMSGLGHELNGKSEPSRSGSSPRFDWNRCVNATTDQHLRELAKWRGYSSELCQWLRQQKLIGRHGDLWAFPVQYEGMVVAAHVKINSDDWIYSPDLKSLGINLQPLVVGNGATATRIIVGESQWDVFAAYEVARAHKIAKVAGIATRGAGNGKLIKDRIAESAEIICLVQSDEAGEKWLTAISKTVARDVRVVRAPQGFKDFNEALLGSPREQLVSALAKPELLVFKTSEPSSPALEKELHTEARTGKPAWPEVEGDTAAALRSKIEDVRCVEDEWFVCKDGVWQPRNRDEFRPLALELLPNQFRTHRSSVEVLKRLEGERQTTRSTFCGAAKFNTDRHPIISVQNGTLCITPNGTLNLPTDPDQGFTIALPIEYLPNATAPLFERVLSEAVPDDADRELFLDVLATALIPDCRYEAALVVIGEAGTGKSTVMAPMPAVFGSACSSLSMADLCHPSGFKLPLLRHRMINLATELNTLELDDSGLFKQLVSGEQFTARPVYGKPFEMCSTATLVFLANSLPRFKSGTEAEVRRLRFVRFDRKVANPDLTLKDRIIGEAPGIFSELVRRASELLRGRALTKPSNWGTETVERFSVSNDPVGQFVQSECDLDREKQCNKALLYDEFTKFRDAHGISDRFDKAVFFRTLYDRFPSVKQSKSSSDIGRTPIVVGIDVKPE